MLNRIIAVLVALPAIFMLIMGLRWLIDPAGIAPEFGFPLLSGLGLSSQVGNMSAFFLMIGVSILLGIVLKETTWFYPPALLLILTAAGRMIAWLAHGATLALQMIAVELVISMILVMAAYRMHRREDR
jgi:uncharacterized membrane protein